MHATCRLVLCCLFLFVLQGPAAAAAPSQPNSGDRLAYISGGKLYVGFPRARLVSGPGNAFQPVFSHDGQWLAFLRQHWNGYAVSSQLWVARADGSGAHAVTPIGSVSTGDFQWSPSVDVLAVQLQNAAGLSPIRLIPAQGSPHAVPDHLQGSFLWLSDGRTLAIAATSPSGYTRLDLIRGTSVRSYSIPGIGRYDPVKLAAWWPAANSIVYWLDRGGCFSCIADGTPLYAFDLRTDTTRRLGVGLIYRDWIAVSGTRLLAVVGKDRSAFFGKHLEICQRDGGCHLVLSRRATISFDPTWAPVGGWNSGSIAFVTAPAWHTWGFTSPARYWAWINAHMLWIARPNGSAAAPVGSVGRGVSDPQWTRDGRGILFVADGSLWGDSHLGAANPVRIARLVPPHFVPSLQKPAFQDWYYGHLNWHDLFAWY